MRSSPLYSLLGIAGRPVDRVERGIVAAGEPGRRAAVLDVLPLPRLRSGLARLGHGPEPPDLLAGLLIVRGDETVRAVLAARHAGDDEIARRERRRRGRVVLAPVVELGVPQQLAREPIERDDVRVVGDHEHAIAGDTGAAVRAALHHALRARPLVVPDPPAAARVERVALVGRRHIHDPVDDDRRHLQVAGVGNREHPARRQLRDVVLVDLRQRRVAVAAGLAVVGRPARLRRDDAKPIAGAPQQVHALVVGPQLQIVEAFAEHLAFERSAVGRLDRRPHDRARAALNRPQELHERGQLGILDDVRGHALGGERRRGWSSPAAHRRAA